MKNRANLRGIVVAGNTRAEAEDNYRAVATGESVSVLTNKDESFIILSNADAESKLMDPLSGAHLVEASGNSVEDMTFLASDSNDIETFYTICSEGCNAHLIADDQSLMTRCAVCATTLKDLSEDEILALSAKQNEDNDEVIGEKLPDALIVVAATREEAEADFLAIATGVVETTAYNCGEGIVVASLTCDFEYSPYSGEAATSIEHAGLTVEASSDEGYDAHWYVCANDECNSHIIASAETPVFCPSCSSGVIDPKDIPELEDDETVASVDDAEELDTVVEEESTSAEEEELDTVVEDETLVASEIETTEQIESTIPEATEESTAGDDDDCDEDEDDDDDDDKDDDDKDDDDKDDDKDEDDDDDDDDDEEVMDNKNTLSVSVVTVEEESEPVDLTSVSTDLLSLTAASGELTNDKFEVAYAGTINKEDTWLAFYEGKPVATAVLSDAGEARSDIFSSKTFGDLVRASAEKNGVVETLEELGFKPIAASVDVETYVQEEIATRVDAQVSESRTGFEKDGADYADRFEAAIVTASEGINKGFFADIKNPIKETLVSTLTALGIKNANTVVATAFANGNKALISNLVGKTKEIMEYNVDVQNQLTAAISGTAAETAVASSETDINLGTVVASTAQPVKQTVVASAKISNLDAALAGLGTKRR